MSLIDLSFDHGRSHDEARAQLEKAVGDASGMLGSMVRDVQWSPDRNRAKLVGNGFWVEIRVDPTRVHVAGDLPLLSRFLMPAIRGALERTFQKRLPTP